MLRLEDVTLAVGTRDLLSGASLHVRPGDRVGLVGRNGTGKTSLLRLLVGELEAESGKVHRRGGARLGYLPQQAVSGSEATVWDEASSRMDRIRALSEAVDRAQRDVEAGVAEAVSRLGDAQESFRLAGGYAVDERIGEVLHGLGFSPEDWHRSCRTFSGGWQMRIALARMLLSDPDILLLDEPTNHLDLASRSWLARHLSGSPTTMVIVSHDRHLLDAVTNHTVEIRHHRLESFHGNLTAWLRERAVREQLLVNTAQKQGEEIAKLERFVERFKAKATKAAQARSRQKRLDRMDRIELPESERNARLRLPDTPGCSRETVVLSAVHAGWEDGTDVLVDVDFVLERGQRVAILGPNGCGKSTLLHLIAGTLPVRSGKRRVGKDVRIGVFRQDLAADLPPDSTGLDHVLSMAPATLPQRARSALGALGLPGDMALRPISSLSGGEKARVVLSAFALQPYNVLLLDEPTNHLDVVTIDVLAEALADFEGALLFVTHDRYLVERLATHVATVRSGVVEVHEGVQPEDLEPGRIEQASTNDKAPAAGALGHEARKQLRRERTRMQRTWERQSKKLTELEARLTALDEALVEVAQDFARAAELSRERDEVEAELESVFEELAELEESLAEGS